MRCFPRVRSAKQVLSRTAFGTYTGLVFPVFSYVAMHICSLSLKVLIIKITYLFSDTITEHAPLSSEAN